MNRTIGISSRQCYRMPAGVAREVYDFFTSWLLGVWLGLRCARIRTNGRTVIVGIESLGISVDPNR